MPVGIEQRCAVHRRKHPAQMLRGCGIRRQAEIVEHGADVTEFGVAPTPAPMGLECAPKVYAPRVMEQQVVIRIKNQFGRGLYDTSVGNGDPAIVSVIVLSLSRQVQL